MGNMYTEYEAELTQLEAEEEISGLFDFIREYGKNLQEHKFEALDNEQFHEV